MIDVWILKCFSIYIYITKLLSSPCFAASYSKCWVVGISLCFGGSILSSVCLFVGRIMENYEPSVEWTEEKAITFWSRLEKRSGDGAEVVIGLFRSLGLAQGHCETNSGPGLALFLLPLFFFSRLFPPFPISPHLSLAKNPPQKNTLSCFAQPSPSPGVFCHSRLVRRGAAEKWRG